jgi:hypothetical protein
MFGVDIGLIFSLGSSLVGALAWYRAIARSQYARERELSHVLRNQNQAQQALCELGDEVDQVGDRLTKIEALLITISGRRLSGEG